MRLYGCNPSQLVRVCSIKMERLLGFIYKDLQSTQQRPKESRRLHTD